MGSTGKRITPRVTEIGFELTRPKRLQQGAFFVIEFLAVQAIGLYRVPFLASSSATESSSLRAFAGDLSR